MLRWKAIAAVAISSGLLFGCSSYFFSSFVSAKIMGPAPVAAEPVAAVPEAEPVAMPEPVVAPLPASTPAPQPAAPQVGDPYVDGAPALPAIDPLLPPAGKVNPIWAPLDQKVRQIAAAFPGRLSVVAVDLQSGARYDFRPNDRYYPASTFKLPVTLCVVQAIDRGELTWDTLVTFTKADDDTVGQGGFANVAYGTQWPVRNLVDRSLISSNNVAVKMLARTLTWEGLAKCTEALGGMVTRTAEGSTPVTAADEAAWWQALWQMHKTRPDLAENLLRPLRQVPYFGRIQSGTPRPDLVTHKFGTYPPYEHDGAIVWGERPYILVVLTYGGDHAGVDGQIEAMARAAWDGSNAK